MEHLDAATTKGDWLAYIAETLRTLSDIAGHAGSPLLKYFLELAAAQARDERSFVANQICGGSASQTRALMH